MPFCIDCGGECTKSHITGFPKPHIGSGSRMFSGNVIGKALTDRRITYYQALGLLNGNGLVLPPITGPQCLLCPRTKNVRHRVVSFLPCGNYCEICYTKARESRDREQELARRVREQSFIYE